METLWLVLMTMNVLIRQTVDQIQSVPMPHQVITVHVLGVSMIQLTKTPKMNWTDKLMKR